MEIPDETKLNEIMHKMTGSFEDKSGMAIVGKSEILAYDVVTA